MLLLLLMYSEHHRVQISLMMPCAYSPMLRFCMVFLSVCASSSALKAIPAYLHQRGSLYLLHHPQRLTALACYSGLVTRVGAGSVLSVALTSLSLRKILFLDLVVRLSQCSSSSSTCLSSQSLPCIWGRY